MRHGRFFLTMSIVLRDAIFWVAVACCAVGSVAILRLTIATPARGLLPTEHEVPRSRRAVEVAWVVLPMLGLALLLAATRREMRRGEAPAAESVPRSPLPAPRS